MSTGHRVDLSPFNTFGVHATATRVLAIESVEQLSNTDFDPARDLVLGGGSNLLLVGDVPGAVLLNRIRERRILGQVGERTGVRLGAGEPWHEAVRWTLDQGLSGLENLSLIPGLAGAAPLQNIGAYGVELAEALLQVEAWDWQARRERIFDREECDFAYRDSRFKSRDRDRFLVTGLILGLDRVFRPRLDYAGVREAVSAAGIAHPTALDVSDAVMRIRRRKLPDPAHIGNAGSFFKNPVVAAPDAERLRADWPGLPLYRAGAGQSKASAAWMIEHCGWKGHREGDAGVSERHALVLVNHGRATGRQIADLAARIVDSVRGRFGLTLVNEPRIIDYDAS